jgi:two-component system chemotaxis response regulator CheY
MMEHKVLIIDDVTEIRGLLRTILMNIGFCNIQEAKDGTTAKAMCQKTHYDVILLDIELPDYSGMDLLKFFIDKYPDTAFIMCSAHSTIDNVKDSLLAGAQSFLVKPFSIKKIKSVLEKVLQ